MARSNAPGVRNPVTLLPAAAELVAMPAPIRATLARLFSQLARDCRERAGKAWRTHKAPMAAYWKAQAVYARHVALILKGKGQPVTAAARSAAHVAMLDQLRGILEDDALSAADVYQCIADDILAPAGLPVREVAHDFPDTLDYRDEENDK